MAVTVVINNNVYAGVASVSLLKENGQESTYLYVTGDPELISHGAVGVLINGILYSGVGVVAIPMQTGETARYVLAAGGTYEMRTVAAGQIIRAGDYFSVQRPLYPSPSLYPSPTLYPSAGGGNTIYLYKSGTPDGIALEDGNGGDSIRVYLPA